MSSALVELRKQLRAEELKLVDLHKASEVAQAARATKSTAAATKFTSSELAEFQRVFDEIDTDKSGTLTVTELGELASRLGVEMTQEQLKRQTEVLDTNNDGVLSFDEFVGWWAAEKSEGGPNMVQMFMLKTRMKAEMVRRSLQKSLAITPDANEAMARISATINVGHGGSSSSKSATSIGFTALPIDNETFEAAMKNKGGDTDIHDGAVEIKFSVRPGTTPEELQNVLPSFQANFGIAFEQLGMGSDFDVKASDDSKFILVKLLTPNVQPNGRPKKKSVLENFLAGNDRSLSSIMSAANLTIEFDRDVSDSFSWAGMEVEGAGGSGGGTICDILKGITASASVRCHRSTVTAIAPEPAFPNFFFKQGFVVGSLLGENAQNVEFVSKLSSPAEMKTVFLRLIEGFPLLGNTPTPEEEASASEVRKCFYDAIAERYDCLLSLTVPEMFATILLVDLYDTAKIPPPTPEELLLWVNWARPDGDRDTWIKPDSAVPATSTDEGVKKEETTAVPAPEDDDAASKSGSDDDDDDDESSISPQQALINSVVTMLGAVDGINEVSVLLKQVNLRITCNNLNVLQLFHLPKDDAERGMMLRKAFIGLHRKIGASMQTRDFSRVKVEDELRDSGVVHVLENILENFGPISVDMLAPPKKVAGFKLPPIDKSDLDWNRKEEEDSGAGADGGEASSDEN